MPAARLWLDRVPLFLPNIPFRSTATVCPVLCPPAASTKQNVAVMSSAAGARGRRVFCAATFLGDAPSKYSVELRCSHETFNKRRSCSSYI